MEFEKKLISGAIKGIQTYIETALNNKLSVYVELTEIKKIDTPACIIYLDSLEPDSIYPNATLGTSFELLVLVGDEAPSSRLECADITAFLMQKLHAEHIAFNGAKGLVMIQDATPVESGLDSEQFIAWRMSASVKVYNVEVYDE